MGKQLVAAGLIVVCLLATPVGAQYPSTVAIEALKALFSEGQNIWSFKSGTAAQTLRVYNTFTSASNFERWEILWTNNVAIVGNASAGAGTLRPMFLATLGRATVGQATPTASGTGFGTGPTISVDTGSADLAGTITVTGGTVPGNSGTLTVTFSAANGAYGTLAPACVAMLGNGTGTWNARATLIGGTFNTAAAIFNWDNNAVALLAGSTYKFHYHCMGLK